MHSCSGTAPRSRQQAFQSAPAAVTLLVLLVRLSMSGPRGAPEWWASGKEGSLSPWAQSQVYAFVTLSEKRGGI